MRDVFCEFYRPDDEALRRFMTTAKVIPDANVLLGLYRLGSSQRAQVLDVLERIKERLWLPYQVGHEYHRNRLGVVAAQASAYEVAKTLHGMKDLAGMRKWLDTLKVPPEVRESILSLLPGLHEALTSATKRYEDAIDALRDEHVVSVAQARKDDPVRWALDRLFNSERVGSKPDQRTLQSRIKDARRRTDERIPPGYMDSEKGADQTKAGDYLIWAEILDFAAGTNAPVLFVTADEKEDWFERFDGEIAGPRSELVAEFAERSPHGYHQVTLGAFLDLANKHLSAQVAEATIRRVNEPTEPDEVHPLDGATERFLASYAEWTRKPPAEAVEEWDEIADRLRRLLAVALERKVLARDTLNRLRKDPMHHWGRPPTEALRKAEAEYVRAANSYSQLAGLRETWPQAGPSIGDDSSVNG